MPYYRGDYVGSGSNYYRGDPFLGALVGGIARSVGLGKVAAKVGRWAVQRISGGSLKKVAGAIGGTVAGVAGTAIVNRIVNPPPVLSAVDELQALPGGAGPMMEAPMGSGGTQWVTTPSGRRMRVRWSAQKGKWVAVRSMNPLNPKALNRALRRATGFEKFAKRTVTALYRSASGTTKQRKFKRK